MINADENFRAARFRETSGPEAFLLKSLVESRDILAVTVEDHGRPTRLGADVFFARLAPARVRHLRIHVRPEAIFGRLQAFPECLRPPVGELETHDRFHRLESILP